MQDRDRDQLKRLIEHAEAARAYARAGGARWWTDQLTRDAVMMRIAQIAEAAKRTSPEALAEVLAASLYGHEPAGDGHADW